MSYRKTKHFEDKLYVGRQGGIIFTHFWLIKTFVPENWKALFWFFTLPLCINISKDKTLESQPKENKTQFGKHWNRMLQHQIVFISSLLKWHTSESTLVHRAFHCRRSYTGWAWTPCKLLWWKTKSKDSCLIRLFFFF